MATLIAVYDAHGECRRQRLGRCDARCYEADLATCDCICGGANHGAGQAVATTQTAARASEWIATYTRERGIETFEADLAGRSIAQLGLFG